MILLLYENDFSSTPNDNNTRRRSLDTNVEQRRRSDRHPATHVPTYIRVCRPAGLPTRPSASGGCGNDAKAEKADETAVGLSVGACVHPTRKVEDSGYNIIIQSYSGIMGRARKNKTHRNAAAQTLAGHLSLARSLSVLPVIGAQHKHTHTHTCARIRICLCVCVCARGVRPPLFARARLHFSAAYLLHDVFIQSTSPLGSRSHTLTYTPPSITLRTKDDTSSDGGGRVCSTRMWPCELATYTHTHTQR